MTEKTMRNRSGYVLPLTVFLLLCTLLWGSVLMLTLSDTHAAGTRQVAQVQSRLLARSGWNLALQQLQTGTVPGSFTLQRGDGTIAVTMKDSASGVQVQATGSVRQQERVVSGTVQRRQIPWREVCSWAVVQNPDERDEAAICFCREATYELHNTAEYPLALAGEGALSVAVTEPVRLQALYIDGDLNLQAPLDVETLCVTGTVSGEEYLTCGECMDGFGTEPGYVLQVRNRNIT